MGLLDDNSLDQTLERSATGDSSEGDRLPIAAKLRPLAALGLVVGATIAFDRLRSRRQRETAKTENTTPGRRLSLFRGK